MIERNGGYDADVSVAEAGQKHGVTTKMAAPGGPV